MSTNQILTLLKEGNLRFIKGQSKQKGDSGISRLKDLALMGQSPKAVVLCCSDSRAPVEMIFDQNLGELFVIRVAGNVVAPSLIGSVEFAVSFFKTSLVVVMGHTQCGAITATLNVLAGDTSIESENIHDIVGRIKPHVGSIAKNSKLTLEEKCEQAVETNVRASVAQLTTSSSLIENLTKSQKLTLVGAVLNLDSGVVNFLD